jgi:hypothetical protein
MKFELILFLLHSLEGRFNVGISKKDITGPIVEFPFMGYGVTAQSGLGLHTRKVKYNTIISIDIFN